MPPDLKSVGTIGYEPRRQGPAWEWDEIQERRRIRWFALRALVSAFMWTGIAGIIVAVVG